MICVSDRILIGIGLGGIATGWLPAVAHFHSTGVLSFEAIHLIDGKKFKAKNRSRQHFMKEENKAAELHRL